MSRCTETDKPQISILMAVYEPRMDWLREQLLSLDAQTYPNLKLYIRDDCSPTVSYDAIQSCARDCIRAFSYELRRNEKNLGSNKTFELLTREADGEFFAYCDQDDVWLPEKLEKLHYAIEREKALLACSDMYIIDGDGKQTADSMAQVRRHHVFYSGENLSPQLVFHNWVTGCTMLVRSTMAKEAIPFCPHMVHDHYLALYCADRGKICCIESPLIYYRIHGNNQTGILAGVENKREYLAIRVVSVRKKINWLQKHLQQVTPQLEETLRTGAEWVNARESYLQNKRGAAIVWKYRKYGSRAALFELCSPLLPERLFLCVVNLARKNIL